MTRPSPSVMRGISAAIARRLTGWLLPSDAAFDVLRISLLNTIALMFFLFFAVLPVVPSTEGYQLWAEALVGLRSVFGLRSLDGGYFELAWRDVGYPLVLVLSGFPWTHSFIGVTIIGACMGLAMPILIYFALRPWFPRAAYWSGMYSVLSLAPLLMFKAIHHDQSYIFFLILTVWFVGRWNANRRSIHIYGFTLATFAMSLIRLIGQGMYPPLLAATYLQSRIELRHFIASAVLFAALTTAYSSYRAHALGDLPPILGEQVFYNVYLNSAEYNVAISPELGPNTRRFIERLHELLLPSPDRSAAATRFARSPRVASTDFPSRLSTLTADKLVETMLREPQPVYLSFMFYNIDDHLLLMTSLEIGLAHPLYILGYTLRNALRLLYDPGYTHAPSATPLVKEGLFFPFAGAGPGFGYNIGDQAPEPALTEARFLALLRQPEFVRDMFFAVSTAWRECYHPASKVLFALAVVAWISTAVGLIAKLFPTPVLAAWSQLWLSDRVIAATSTTSLLLLFNVGLSALLVNPLYRFDFSVLMLKIMLAAVGGAVFLHLASSILVRGGGLAARVSSYYPWPRRHMAAAAGGLALLVLAGLGGWAWYMRTVPMARPAEGTIHVLSAGGNCGDEGNDVRQHVISACSGQKACDFMYDERTLRPPGSACYENFRIEWSCSAADQPMSHTWPRPAQRDRLHIACP